MHNAWRNCNHKSDLDSKSCRTFKSKELLATFLLMHLLPFLCFCFVFCFLIKDEIRQNGNSIPAHFLFIKTVWTACQTIKMFVSCGWVAIYVTIYLLYSVFIPLRSSEHTDGMRHLILCSCTINLDHNIPIHTINRGKGMCLSTCVMLPGNFFTSY